MPQIDVTKNILVIAIYSVDSRVCCHDAAKGSAQRCTLSCRTQQRSETKLTTLKKRHWGDRISIYRITRMIEGSDGDVIKIYDR